jgi:hypothetical protein
MLPFTFCAPPSWTWVNHDHAYEVKKAEGVQPSRSHTLTCTCMLPEDSVLGDVLADQRPRVLLTGCASPFSSFTSFFCRVIRSHRIIRCHSLLPSSLSLSDKSSVRAKTAIKIQPKDDYILFATLRATVFEPDSNHAAELRGRKVKPAWPDLFPVDCSIDPPAWRRGQDEAPALLR